MKKKTAKKKAVPRKQTPRSETSELLAFAIDLAYEAGALTLRYYGGLVDADDKSDGSPVTIADRKAEQLIRKRVGKRYPEHAVLGEEYGESNAGARVRWILDPIDGTRSFMHGVPLYGVLIGIEAEGEPIVGVTYFPPLDEMVAAGRGLGCKWNGKPCRVSSVSRMQDAVVCTTDVERLLKRPEGLGWRRLQQRSAFSRTWGDCYGHALVATGRIEVQVDPVMKPWDAGPFLTITTEAGGKFTTLDGKATIHGGSGISTNGLLHGEVLRELASGGRGGSPQASPG
ncbi:MAG: inositol monophosphatase family protein [Gemmatimonadetes bacterium]|nr:inositol monophosphatase family protein [Gemmatimonadota bacterium]